MLDLIRQHAQSWGVKIAFGIIILVFVFWGVGSYDQAGPNVAATVNGKPILMQEFMNELRMRQERIRAMMPGLGSEEMKSLRLSDQVMQTLVTRSMLEGEASRLGITVTPVELLRFVSLFPDFHGPDGKFDKGTYEASLKRQGRKVVDFEQEMMRSLLVDKMRSFITSAVTLTPGEARRRFAFQMERRVASYVLFPVEKYNTGITIADESVKSYYDANQPRFAEPAMTSLNYIEVTPESLAAAMVVGDDEIDAAFKRGPQRFNLRQLVLTFPAGDAAKEAEAKATAEALVKEIRGGKDFVAVATEKSEDPSAAEGGMLGWLQARQLPAEMLAAVQKLTKGAISDPVHFGSAYVVFKLEDTDPDWTQPEATVKEALKASLAEEKAMLAFRDTQSQAEDMVALNKTLEEIAASMHTVVKETNLVPRDALNGVLALRRPVGLSFFEGEAGKLVGTLLETENGFVIAAIKEQKAARIRPLDEAKEGIVETLVRREAEKKAEEAARAAVVAFAKGVPDAYKDKVLTTPPFGRQGDIPELGVVRPLVDALFAAPLDAWLPQPYATPKGAVLAMPVEAISLNDQEWETLQARVTESLLEMKQNEVFVAFLAELNKNVKVSVPRPEILEQ